MIVDLFVCIHVCLCMYVCVLCVCRFMCVLCCACAGLCVCCACVIDVCRVLVWAVPPLEFVVWSSGQVGS